MTGKEIKINDRTIGPNSPPYIIAEMSGNHNQSLERALNLIGIAAKAGADAIKFQTYTADTLTIDCEKEDFKIRGGLWDGYNLYRLYKWAHTPFEWHKEMFDHARKIGITCFSTPFDESAVDLLEDLNSPAYKIASFEAVDLPLIRYVAQTRKPMIISTGMANLEEITEAVETAREHGCKDLVLLHCISGYPAPIEQTHLRTIPDLAERFNLLTGLSDHTLGTTVAIAGVAQGACVIEKHFTTSREDKGPDSAFSLEPHELELLCSESKNAWAALGSAGYELKSVEEASMIYRRSIYTVKDIKKGELLTEENIRRIRPGYGLSPKFYEELIGKTAKVDLEIGTAVDWGHV
jgi:pseudaminic acid synthase